MDTLSYLKKTDLFKDLEESALSELAGSSRVRRLSQKETLFNEGDEGTHFFVLIEGSVRAFKTSADGKESTIKIIAPGEYFAETVLFGKRRYPATVAASVESTVIAVQRDLFLKMLERDDTRNAFIAFLFSKLRYLTDQIHYLTSHDVEERFFRFLSNTYGKRDTYEIPLQKKDVASAIGTIPETFSRLLLRLSRDGTLRWDKSALTLRKGFWEEYEAGPFEP